MSSNGRHGRIDRRTFFKRSAGLAITISGVGGLLQACTTAPAPSPTSAPAVIPTVVGPTAAPAATSAPAAAAIKRGGILREAAPTSSVSYDSHLQDNGTGAEMYMLYDTLLRRVRLPGQTEKFEIQPGLAQSYEIIDPTTMELRLRRGVKFHDGSDFNASIAAWNIERAGTLPKSSVKNTVANISKVDVVDDFTLRLHLKKPQGLLPLLLSNGNPQFLGMVSKQAVEKLGDKFGASPVGTGPFKFKELVKDDHFAMDKFPGHWEFGADGQPLPYLDGFVERYIMDSAALLMELKASSIDQARVRDIADLPTVMADANLTATPQSGLWTSFPGMYINPRPNTSYLFSNDKRLRQAAQYAIDRKTMAKALGQGVGRPAYYPFFFPGMTGYDESLPKYPFDLAKAKQLVAEAGYATSGVDLEVTVINRTSDTKPLEVLQAMWAAAGIRLKINGIDRDAWLNAGKTGKFEALSHGFNQYADAVVGGSYARTGSTQDWSGYSNPEVDKLYDAAELEYDDTKRAEIYKQMQTVFYNEAFFVTGYMIPQMIYMNKRVHDVSNYTGHRYIWLS